MNIFKGWTKFELMWLGIFTIINLYLFFAWEDSFIGLVSSTAGILCVVLVAKGKIANYYFGIIQASTYAYISFNYGLYGEAMLNGIFYFPLQFVGIYLWNRSKVKNTDKVSGEDVIVRRMTKKHWVVVITTTTISIILYTIFLTSIGGNTTGLDSTTTVLSIVAQILMLKRFAEQWVIWIVINVLSIIMWVIALNISEVPQDNTMVVMWSAFLLNSIYGYYNWLKLEKKQNKE